MDLFDWAITKLTAVGCMVLLAATLSLAQDSEVGSESTTQPTSKLPAHSHKSTTSHSKGSKSTGTSTHSSAKGKKSRKTAGKRTRGQQRIDAQRTLEIQEALIREHYLTGKPSGVWNDATQQAMQRYQADNNWQSKTTPDARALIKLGLGPDHQHLLNPESAMTTQPQGTHDASISSQPSTATPSKPQQ